MLGGGLASLTAGCATAGARRGERAFERGLRGSVVVSGAQARSALAGPLHLLHVDYDNRQAVELYSVARHRSGTDADCAAGPALMRLSLHGRRPNPIDADVGAGEVVCLVDRADRRRPRGQRLLARDAGRPPRADGAGGGLPGGAVTAGAAGRTAQRRRKMPSTRPPMRPPATREDDDGEDVAEQEVRHVRDGAPEVDQQRAAEPGAGAERGARGARRDRIAAAPGHQRREQHERPGRHAEHEAA